eukprot:5689264-Prymnesium_polylepis.1
MAALLAATAQAKPRPRMPVWIPAPNRCCATAAPLCDYTLQDTAIRRPPPNTTAITSATHPHTRTIPTLLHRSSLAPCTIRVVRAYHAQVDAPAVDVSVAAGSVGITARVAAASAQRQRKVHESTRSPTRCW